MKSESQYILTRMDCDLKRVMELCILAKLDSNDVRRVGTSLNALSKELKLFTRQVKRAKV